MPNPITRQFRAALQEAATAWSNGARLERQAWRDAYLMLCLRHSTKRFVRHQQSIMRALDNIWRASIDDVTHESVGVHRD